MRRNWHQSARIAALVALTLSAPFIQGSVGRTTNLETRLLAAHNRERVAAGVPALHWDETLATSAEEWGAHLALLGDLEHAEDDPSDPERQGENLWQGTASAYSPEEMVDMWIDEKAHFVAGRFPENSRTGSYEDIGHYTQLMWRETGKVGCALVPGAEDEVLVCRYSQAGNVMGQRPF